MKAFVIMLVFVVIGALAGAYAGYSYRDSRDKKLAMEYFVSASRLYNKQQFPEAAQDFNRSIGLDANFTPAHLLLSDTYKKMGLDSLAQTELAAGGSASGGGRPRMETVTGVGK
jgi:tetratricopeptide (TPR) repeat protein